MRLATTVVCIAIGVAVVGCDDPAPPAPVASATAKVSAAPSASTSAKAPEYEDRDIAVAADFEKALADEITAANYKDKLADVRAELEAATDGPRLKNPVKPAVKQPARKPGF